MSLERSLNCLAGRHPGVGPLALLLLAGAAAGCGADKKTNGTPMPGADAAVVAAADSGATPDAAVGDDGPSEDAPPPRDLGRDRLMGGTPLQRYQEFLGNQDSLLGERRAECFNGVGPRAGTLQDTSDLQLSLRLGLLSYDEAAGQVCLKEIETESCQALAAEAHQATCAKVLVGQLANGGFCRLDQDCREPAQQFCRLGMATTCTTRCQPRTPNLALCASSSECALGSICRPGPDPMTTICTPRLAAGEECDSDICAPGLYCRPDSPDGPAGMCAPIKVGEACAGGWQCPPYYACLIPTGGMMGTCGPGRKAGEACQLQPIDQTVYTDCGFDLGCYPDVASGQLKCSLGRKMDEPCADDLPCATGQCVASKCSRFRTTGESCTDEESCETGLACVAGKCAPEAIPAGSPCGGTDPRGCIEGTFCNAPVGSMTPGTCTPLKKVDEPCQPTQCEPTLDCVAGLCRRC